MLSDAQRKQLDNIYYDPSDAGSYGGIERLYKRSSELKIPGVNRNVIREYLSEQTAYTLHKPARRHFIRNRTYVHGIDHQWQADLADMQGLQSDNDHYRYILTVIDVFSKHAWVQAVTSKSSKEVTNAFQAILKRSEPRKPERLQTDKGKEFFNKDFQTLLRVNKIHHFASESDQKAAVVERFNRTLKSRIWTFLSAKQTSRWIDALPKIVTSYNNSYHRSIRMAPANVQKNDESKLWVRLYGDGDTELKQLKSRWKSNRPLKEGTMVRVNRVKGQFEKGYMPNWSREHFLIDNRAGEGTFGGARPNRPTYKLKDYNGESVSGTWYPEELQDIKQNEYRIEQIIKRRKAADGSREFFVKWLGWPDKFNSWVSENDIIN